MVKLSKHNSVRKLQDLLSIDILSKSGIQNWFEETIDSYIPFGERQLLRMKDDERSLVYHQCTDGKVTYEDIINKELGERMKFLNRALDAAPEALKKCRNLYNVIIKAIDESALEIKKILDAKEINSDKYKKLEENKKAVEALKEKRKDELNKLQGKNKADVLKAKIALINWKNNSTDENEKTLKTKLKNVNEYMVQAFDEAMKHPNKEEKCINAIQNALSAKRERGSQWIGTVQNKILSKVIKIPRKDLEDIE